MWSRRDTATDTTRSISLSDDEYNNNGETQASGLEDTHTHTPLNMRRNNARRRGEKVRVDVRGKMIIHFDQRLSVARARVRNNQRTRCVQVEAEHNRSGVVVVSYANLHSKNFFDKGKLFSLISLSRSRVHYFRFFRLFLASLHIIVERSSLRGSGRRR
jgi:hypothetical protein